MHAKETEATRRLLRSLRGHGVEPATLALVLGSGLGLLAERIERANSIPYADIDGLPVGEVPGHAGRLVTGSLGGVRVIVQQGRVHLYEGWSEEQITRAIRAFALLGVRGIVLTNAAGGVRPDLVPGTLMRITDHINLQGRTPLRREERGFGSPWDPGLGAALQRTARRSGATLAEGVYAGLLGPTYETPAEVRLLRSLGADAVGMSTVAEALAAHASGMRVVGISCITNPAAGLGTGPLGHEEVVEVGRRSSAAFCSLLEASARPLAEALTG